MVRVIPWLWAATVVVALVAACGDAVFEARGEEPQSRHSAQRLAQARATLEDLEQKKGDFKRAVALLERTGALAATLDRAARYGAEARAALAGFADGAMRAALEESVEFAVRRAY